MNRATIRISAILSSLMFFAYALASLLNFLIPHILNFLIDEFGMHISALVRTVLVLPSGIFVPLAVLLPACVLLINGIGQIRKKQGVRALIFAILSVLISGAWTVLYLLDTILNGVHNYVMYELLWQSGGVFCMSAQDWISFMSGADLTYKTLVFLQALALLLVFLLSVLTAKKKWWQIKAELHKLCAACIAALPLPVLIVQFVINRIMANASIDVYIAYSNVMNYLIPSLYILLALLFGVLILALGVFIKKDRKPVLQQQPESEDLPKPEDLPAGVYEDPFA